jgi:hypothetical protein
MVSKQGKTLIAMASEALEAVHQLERRLRERTAGEEHSILAASPQRSDPSKSSPSANQHEQHLMERKPSRRFRQGGEVSEILSQYRQEVRWDEDPSSRPHGTEMSSWQIAPQAVSANPSFERRMEMLEKQKQQHLEEQRLLQVGPSAG